ncbi:MAG: glycogen/starch/alpha-glucan phosphorylase [Nitrospina sp.]|jgi:glycogen phosphorylase|nr:glycogen/starch/alpha-glucan phosphorylase [Nitrospina sp.]MBT3874823.1 glycogen/starch/alpha-glucan phosphorylase [Nitrospina sp.]MBT4048015.1 glycogen/starch/alpha-glucan phosphorylase [Nitrospina sp.]MBT4555974.1 glycogen/starch/alpha-glucan phosphorylase [Nitrospina sp.]MBT5348045.1 glycogen/starch/alpha-glucan phosphorylase [Nitrospina sp.]
MIDKFSHEPGKVTREALKLWFQHHLKYTLVDDKFSATKMDHFISLALSVRDHLVSRWLQTQQSYHENNVKRVYYLSMEFLIGRLLTNNLINLGIYDEYKQALDEMGYDISELEETEVEAGLGNGGLGRLAACFLDSIASLGIPGYGYGIRYEFGIFHQKIVRGYQVEMADNWLRVGNPWEIPRPRSLVPVNFYGRVESNQNAQNKKTQKWIDTQNVMAMAHDIPIPGYKNNTVNNLRLWSARSSRELELEHFQAGDYFQAVQNKHESEIISKVLYPADHNQLGKELRFKQEYFFVSASLSDIVRRYKKRHTSFDMFSEKVAIQLNDTHPALAIVELMRILTDLENVPWEKAWKITVDTFAFTNHTILPEAMEKWSAELFGRVLPRHLEIIFKINQQFMDQILERYPDDVGRMNRMSLIEENHTKYIRMANLSIIGSHSTNGVAELHSTILREKVFSDFHEMFPNRFNNKTNGITPRRWLKACNPELSKLITDYIGDSWVHDLSEIKKLQDHINDSDLIQRWKKIKTDNKILLSKHIKDSLDLEVDPNSLFETQIKRIHEYKRQVLSILHAIALYNRIRRNPENFKAPRTIMFSGKAAPGYAMAKLIIKFINCVADTINTDTSLRGKLKVVFLPNYSVTLAEKIIPASDLSVQISTAGMEASGTGNMKLSLNGALTVGTLDGANIEIMEEVGNDNIFIFGLNANEVMEKKQAGYQPRDLYTQNLELREVLDMVRKGFFSGPQGNLFQPILENLLDHGDPYMVLADFQPFCDIQEEIGKAYLDSDAWIRKSIINVSRMGKFSSDRSIKEYADNIWNIPVNPKK